jgi:hypothetical protein
MGHWGHHCIGGGVPAVIIHGGYPMSSDEITLTLFAIALMLILYTLLA